MIFSYTWARQPLDLFVGKMLTFLTAVKIKHRKIASNTRKITSGKIISKQDVLCRSHQVHTWQWKTQTHTHTNTQRKHKLYKNASTVFIFFFLLNFQSFTASFGKGRHSMIVLLTLYLNILKRRWSFVYRFQSHECTVLLFFLQINTWKICVVLAPQRSSRHRVTVADHSQHPPPPPPSLAVVSSEPRTLSLFTTWVGMIVDRESW